MIQFKTIIYNILSTKFEQKYATRKINKLCSLDAFYYYPRKIALEKWKNLLKE